MATPEIPRCGVFIRKEIGVPALQCENPASVVIHMTDPDDETKVVSVLLLCDEHDRKFEDGHALVLANADGQIEIVKSDQPPAAAMQSS